MRHYIAILLLLIGQNLFAQYNPDTTISKRTLDSLQHELARHKDALRINYLMDIVKNNTATIDSIYSHLRDTLSVLNHSSRGQVLRRQTLQLNSNGYKTFLNDAYYDTTGKLIYEEQWKLGLREEDNGITGFMSSRSRYHYDSLGRESGVTTEFWDGGGHRVRKVDYTIDASSNKVWGERHKLSQYAFWD